VWNKRTAQRPTEQVTLSNGDTPSNQKKGLQFGDLIAKKPGNQKCKSGRLTAWKKGHTPQLYGFRLPPEQKKQKKTTCDPERESDDGTEKILGKDEDLVSVLE